MVIKTGRRMSSLDLGNGNSDADELAASPSEQSNSNNRSILGQPSYVIPVDYSFGNTPLTTHHPQDDVGTNSQRSHGPPNNSTNDTSQSDNRATLKPNCSESIKNSDREGENLNDTEGILKEPSRTQSNEQRSDEADDSMTDSSVKIEHNIELSESSGQKRLALSPPLSSSVVYPSSPERYNDNKGTTQKLPSPLDRHNFLYNRRDHQERQYKTTNNNREDGEIIESEDEKEDGEIFGSKADLQLHTQIHMREAKPYKCTQCNKSFANSSYLSQHTRIHLGIKPYKCEICQRKFTQLSHLQQHIRTHTGDKPYKCRHPGCTKAFSQLSNLQSHSRCHQTDKPYKCNSCYKCFVDETALLEHIPKHKESKHLKTHICQYCGKSYTQETYLAKHMQKHSDRKEPRAPIVAMGGTNGTSGQGNGQTNGNNTGNSTGGNSLAALGSATSTSSVSQSVVDSYWQKVDPAAYAAHAAHHDRSGDYLGMADPRLNPHAAHQAAAQAVAARDMDMQRDMDAMRHAQLTGGYGDPSGAGVAKTSSAFSPIQGSMLQTAAAAQAAASQGAFAMSAGSRGYSFYDPIGFPKHHSQVGFDSKPGVGGANCFPNQLISLSQIRNYAHQPELLHSLKEK